MPPERPSLVGMSRAVLADALGEAGVPPAQRKMRVQQLWHWLYVGGVQDFADMTSVSKDLRAELARRFTLGAAGDRCRAGLARWDPKVVAPSPGRGRGRASP